MREGCYARGGESVLASLNLLLKALPTFFSDEPSRRGKVGALWACGPSCAPLHPPGPPRWGPPLVATLPVRLLGKASVNGSRSSSLRPAFVSRWANYLRFAKRFVSGGSASKSSQRL